MLRHLLLLSALCFMDDSGAWAEVAPPVRCPRAWTMRSRPSARRRAPCGPAFPRATRTPPSPACS